MPSLTHVSRRGAVYYWRRRLPLGAAGDRCRVIVVSLGTKDQDKARRIGAELTMMSEELFEQAKRALLRPDEVKAILVSVAKHHAQKLELHVIADRARPQPEPMGGERADRIVGAVYHLLAERGRAAELSGPDDSLLQECRVPPTDAAQVEMTLAVLRSNGLVPPRLDKLQRLLAEHASGVAPSAVVLAQTETAFYRGMAAACLNTAPRWSSTLAEDIAVVSSAPCAPAEARLCPKTPPTVVPKAAPTTAATSGPKPPSAGIAEVPTTITGLADKLAAIREKSQEWTDKTARQMRQSAGLLARVVGHDEFTRLTQRDFATFRDVLLELPKCYGKSAKDHAKPIAKLIAAGRTRPENERGAEPATINRHLTHLGSLINFASSYGLHPPQPIKLSELRAKKTGRSRDDRPPMSLHDMKAIFALPPWHGCASESARLQSGAVVVHDALYWIPLIAFFSLARREEVCGLMIVDVVFDAPIPYFDIRLNQYRRLKNAQSKRKVPIHPELLRLGLRDYVLAIGALGYDLLFPDLVSARGADPLGDQFQDLWSPILSKAVPDAETTGKVFHSIRHFGNDALVDARVMIEWRQDIMGHGGRSETEERYRDTTRLRRKLSALKKLPDLTSNLVAHLITLRGSVIQKLARTPRRVRSVE